MLQNARVAAFTVSESFSENQQGGKITLPSPPPSSHMQIRVKNTDFIHYILTSNRILVKVFVKWK